MIQKQLQSSGIFGSLSYCITKVKSDVSFTPNVTLFLSINSQSIFPPSLGHRQDVFQQMWAESLCSFWWAVVFFLNSLIDATFAQSPSYCSIMISDLKWEKWGLQVFRCCSPFFCDLLDESAMRSWSNLVGRLLLGRFTTVPSSLHLWIISLTVVHWRPKALKMAFGFSRS